MAKVCDVCGKGTRVGSSIIRHGMAKKDGGIGLHTTGVTRRRFLPNLQRIRVKTAAGTKTQSVCTSCIKGGKIAKA